MTNAVENQEKKSKTTKLFQTYRNMIPLKKIRGKSFEDALGDFRKSVVLADRDRSNYYEIKREDGKLVPVFAEAR